MGVTNHLCFGETGSTEKSVNETTEENDKKPNQAKISIYSDKDWLVKLKNSSPINLLAISSLTNG